MNGAPLAGVVEADIARNNHLAADRFRVRAALSARDAAALSDAAPLMVDVRASLGGPARSLVTGEADSLVLDPVRGTLEIDGRDLTARLLDTRTGETFANRTSSEIAEILAARHGLVPAVTPTATPAGRFYGGEREQLTLSQFSRATTEWDLLAFLAAQEGFDVWVEGETLHFAPPPAAQPGLLLTPADCVHLRMERVLTLARDIEVTVRSWNSRQGAALAQTARRAGGGGRGGAVQRVIHNRPNLTAAEAMTLANRILSDLSRHERTLALTIPGELGLTPRGTVTLAGTGTAFDATYAVAELHRALSPERGFTEVIRARTLPGAVEAG